MVIVFCVLSLFGIGQSGSVGLFQPLFPRNFAQGDDGSFYILDAREHKIRHYSQQITLLNEFGSRGEGPGEFFFSDGISFFDGVVYIEDAVFFTLFDSRGKPLQKIKKPFDADWFPTGKSWIAYNLRSAITRGDFR
ncbi:hypothetical protein [Acanthopleuribacter pedis]|uniref:6-bladed beta-propeller n=1 Tax=Acanthopleuribacter pedis TaxID=442870 RepID=A0A8J7QHR2_9BACT|nr:hypothetical protein [Acanthopleuribacter pedis]MBO1322680.1 hypothetical protein [Acanthopleuribacter pedis]